MTGDEGREALRRMLLIRRFEERVAELGTAIAGHRHVAIGQEAVAVAVALRRKEGDTVVSNHRNHAHNLALGADPAALFAEMAGRDSPVAHGKSGTFHLSAPDLGLVCTPAIVAAGMPIACGLAYAAKLRGRPRVTVAFFGDGALNEGAAHEALNLAGLWRLPVVFVCENNSGQEAGRASDLAVSRIVDLGSAYGMPAAAVDGADYAAVAAAVAAALARARGGEGPTLLEVRTKPWYGTVGGWPTPRPATPLRGVSEDPADAAWANSDPVRRWAEAVVGAGWLDWSALEAWDALVRQRVADAWAAAQAVPWPEAGTAYHHLWA